MQRKSKMRTQQTLKKNEKLRNTGNSDRCWYAEKVQNADGTKFEKNEKITKYLEFWKAAICRESPKFAPNEI